MNAYVTRYVKSICRPTYRYKRRVTRSPIKNGFFEIPQCDEDKITCESLSRISSNGKHPLLSI